MSIQELAEEQAQKDRTRNREQRRQKTRKWVSAKFLSDYFEVSTVTIWTWAREGKIPPPKKFSPNCTRFDFDKIQAQESVA